MSRARSSNPLTDLLTTLFGGLLAYTYVYLPMLIGMLAAGCLFIAKKPLTRLLRLERWGSVRSAYVGFFHFLQLLGGVMLFCAIGTASALLQPSQSPKVGGLTMLAAIVAGLCGSILCSVLHWVRVYANDAEVQRKVAGWRAEDHVARLLESARRRHPDWQLWHGVLLVFAEGTAEEFSVEIDHLLLTASQIFLIETKFRSGTITALPDAGQWRVQTPHGEGTMRNALAQVKQTARVLRQQWQLAVPVIPIVAIHGQGTRIEQGPGNVVAADAVLQVIDAFEAQRPNGHPPPSNFAGRIQQHRRSSAQAMHAHIARAQTASAKAQRDQVRDCSSLQ